MNRKSCADMFEIVCLTDFIESEKRRLTAIINSPESPRNRKYPWMYEYVQKPTEDIFKEKSTVRKYDKPDDDYIDTDYHCSICFETAEKLLSTSFSFCDEYGCGMNLCKDCAIKIGKLAETM